MTRQALDAVELADRIRWLYHRVADYPQGDFHFPIGRPVAQRLGYPVEALDQLPAGAVESFAGVGFHLDLAAVAPGEVVLDLGCGSGTDTLLAARQTGPAGRVIGVDLTEEQLAKATRMATAAGLANVEFRHSGIESLPLPEASVDLVISNGVINLVPDKAAMFREISRVLRPGGRLAWTDIVSDDPLPESITCDAALWASCVGGAMQLDDYRRAASDAGLRIEQERDNDYRFLSDGANEATRQWGVRSISLLARCEGP